MTAKNRAPWMKLDVDAWLSSPAVTEMLPEQEGAYARLLFLAWKQDPPCTLPADDETLARLSRLGARWKRLGPLIRAQFELVEGGRMRNRRQYQTYLSMLSVSEKRREVGSKGAARRWEEGEESDGNPDGKSHSKIDSNPDGKSHSKIDSNTGGNADSNRHGNTHGRAIPRARDALDVEDVRDVRDAGDAQDQELLPAQAGISVEPAREAPASPAPAAPAARGPSNAPPGALRWFAHFCPRGTTEPQRRRRVWTQVLETLTLQGALWKSERGRKVYVRAGSPERLSAKCDEHVEQDRVTPMRDRDKAIVVLLTKLNDTADVTEGARAEVNAEVQRDERRVNAVVDEWIREHPERYATLCEEADREVPGKSPFQRHTRVAWVRSRIMEDLQRQNGGGFAEALKKADARTPEAG